MKRKKMMTINSNLNKLFLLMLLIFTSQQILAVDTSRPDKLVSSLTDKIVKQLKKEKPRLDKNPSQVNSFARKLARQVKPHWDIVRTSAYIIGKPWRSASKSDKKTFMREFENLLIRTYSKALLKYADQKIEMLPYRHKPSKKQVKVKSRFIQSGGSPVNITYSLYKHKSKGWRVYDVTVGGFNLISNFKGQYQPIVKKSDLGGLNKVLKSKS